MVNEAAAAWDNVVYRFAREINVYLRENVQ